QFKTLPIIALTADVEMTDATFFNFGGKIHFLADLNGSGDSVAAIMAGLNGLLEFDVRDATLKTSFITGFGSDLLSSLNPFSKNEETTELLCAIILFDIDDGIAEAHRKIAGKMTEVTYFGGGEINLKTEKINLGVNPRPRKGLGISLGGIAKLVYIGGTLARPTIKLDPKAMAITLGKYSAAVASGGLTWAADL
ncbi:MAG: AsmA-like C-terminal region-containing protein, partial [Planctomycetes bacterium]|nr:AsmA-like C-terminal region-containing protein [Planctomycetota bacterium]